MKAVYAIVFAGLLALAWADLTDEQKKKLAEHKKVCVEQTKPNMEFLEKFGKGEKVEFDENTNCFFKCVLQKTQILKDDDTVNEEVALAKAPKDVPKEKLNEVISTCKAVEGKNSCEKGKNMFMCMMKYKLISL